MTHQNGLAPSPAQPQLTNPMSLEYGIQALLQQSQQTNATLNALVQQIGQLAQSLTVGQAGAGLAPAPPAQTVPEGEWQKTLQRATCAEVGVSKTRSLNKWKINFHMYGERKPASVYGHGGYNDLMRFMAEVWPELSPDHFSEEQFNHENKKVRDATPDRTYEARYTLSRPFVVEWYDGPPVKMSDGRMMVFRYAERVYPIE